MKGTGLVSRDRRALSVGALCLAGLVLLFKGVPAWFSWRADRMALAQESLERANQLETLVGTFEEAMDSLQARTIRVRDDGQHLVAGETATEAGANLTALASRLARESLVRIDAVELRIDSTHAKGFPRLSVRLQATADIAGLSDFVQAIERGPIQLAISNLSIRGSNPDAPVETVQPITFGMTIDGVALLIGRKQS